MSWGTLELLVEVMQGATRCFHELWLAATAPVEHVPLWEAIATTRTST